jgi:cellulose synthase/poly-beta-1,6-N-acetylglucosamine synthase-like glycosyltransferase
VTRDTGTRPPMLENPSNPARDVAGGGVTVIVPAYNEANHISETIKSLHVQTVSAEEIIVVDDCSTDGTGDIAASLGASVVRPPSNTGSKAGAQTYALWFVSTEFTVAVDADTTLAEDAIERIMDGMRDGPDVVAACGVVLPRRVQTVWERGRYIEYLLAFNFYKPIQDYYKKPLISSGCFSIYRTDALQEVGGWQTRTMAEDMDLTWTFYQRGWDVRFVSEAVCYPLEPEDFGLMRKQLRRWSHGFVQNIMLHWKGILRVAYLRSLVAIGLADAAIASIAFLFLIPILSVVLSPFYLLGYAIDAPVILIPVLAGASARGESVKALVSYPAFFLLRVLNGMFVVRAVWMELIARSPLKIYEKGH